MKKLIRPGIYGSRYLSVVQHRNDGEDGTSDKDKDNKPSAEEAKLIKEVMAKKDKINSQAVQIAAQATKSEEQAAALSDMQEKLKAFDGVDMTAYQELLDTQKKQADKKLEDEGEWDKLKANMQTSFESEKTQMADAHKSALEALKTDSQKIIDDLNDKLNGNNALIENLTVGASFSGSKYVSDDLVPQAAHVRTLYGSHFDVENGKVVAYDKPRGNAERAKLVDAEGQSLKFDSAIEKIISSDANGEFIIRSQQKPGSNSDTQNADGKAGKTIGTGVNRIKAALDKAK